MIEEKTALVAMSGGVDSSVAALLTKEAGYRVLGCTMRLYENEDAGIPSGRTCCSLDDVEDARSVARKIGIPYQVFNFTGEFRSRVMERFAACYEAGGTPNPCLDCNRFLKFDRLLRRADELGYRMLVTGHYAKIGRDEEGRFTLLKGPDPRKDQSYFLCGMTQAQLSRTLFPLGSLTKEEVRRIAEEHGFLNAEKPDSQDICFVPDGDYAAFLRRFTGRDYPEGDFILRDGTVVGRHKGIVNYTVGQRRGLGVAWTESLYVIGKDLDRNAVILGPEKELYVREVRTKDMNWIRGIAPSRPFRCTAVTRYHQKEAWAEIVPLENGGIRAVFDEPRRAVSPGQAVVLYDGDRVIGGGEAVDSV
ncbi:MAG: tRNA 2-thiouridine(34) synthase MnmA [Ruminococcaceae bacterium]|nr:tRNA 2-thiouridine(34) synthase MnmA [Oscillospiraceae bacterium]